MRCRARPRGRGGELGRLPGRLSRRVRESLVSDRAFVRASYRRAFGVELDLSHPRTLNEKIQWRKLYDRDPRYTELADKYRVRAYVRERVGEAYLVPLLLATGAPDEIDFEALPERFVLKANHGCGWNLLVPDKSTLDRRAAVERAGAWLRADFSRRHREWQYRDIPPIVLVEELLRAPDGALPVEYRFLCFDGTARYVEVVSGRFGPSLRVDYYDRSWAHLPVSHDVHGTAGPLPRPSRLDEMVAVAERLASGISFVRVDLSLAGDRLAFGELTFTPCAGYLRFHPPDYDRIFGESWHLPAGRPSGSRRRVPALSRR